MRDVLRLIVIMMLVLGVPGAIDAAAGPAVRDRPADDGQTDKKTDKKADEKTDGKDDEADTLTLERLFPEKGLFGPSARAAAFSHDGRYGAYLYRPYAERRHGTDLWIYDAGSNETRRVTMVSVMADFQESTRTVRKDRSEKAKKHTGEQKTDETPDADDPVSGTWEGRLGGEQDGVPPGGVACTIVLERGEAGSVSGTVKSSLLTAALAEATFDAAAGVLAGRLREAETDADGTLRLEIAGDEMTGTITVDEKGLTLDVTARRVAETDATEAEAGGDAEDGASEDDTDAERDDDENDDEQDQGDVVGDDDADDEKAPRYDGVSTYTWAPHASELIFTSGGDLYRYDVEADEIVRLTRTGDPERDVQYLPDGSGYTYRRGGALVRVVFGDHLISQLDPKLGDGERMTGYRLSPDGTRLVILSGKGEGYGDKGRKVNIVNYRDRFAKVRQVTRHVADDPMPEYESSVYLYDLTDHFTERDKPKKVYAHKQSGPRDIMRVPEWAPDSSRVAFAVYEQSTGHVEILEARFLPPEESDDADGGDEPDDATVDDAEREGDDAGDDGTEDDDEKDDPRIDEAKVIYRFLHNGGPTTPRMIRPYYLADSRHLVFVTEMSGFRHLHVLDPVYERLEQLTRGAFEVYPFGISEDHERLFVLASEDDPTQQHVYVVELESGELRRLSTGEGYYSSAAVSPDGRRSLASFVDFGAPPELVAVDAESGTTTPLTDSHPEEAKTLSRFVPEYFTYENRYGHTIHGHMFKPDDWTPEDRRPLLIYVYGGPLGTRKMATRGAFSAPSYFFAYYMAKKHGYVTCTIDPRGVSGYGGLFEKSNFEQVGRPQVEDLVDATKWFVDNHGVDAERLGLHGWSFGGFQTQLCLYTEPEVFACGIAGAGPTEWENYNSWYATGTIGPSRTGAPDLEKFSLLPLAKNLEARLLLVHGMEDSNVLYQDTVRVYRELLKAGKEALVELFLDPTGGHGLGGEVKTLNRYRKYEDFLLRTLGRGEPAAADEAPDETPASKAGDAG